MFASPPNVILKQALTLGNGKQETTPQRRAVWSSDAERNAKLFVWFTVVWFTDVCFTAIKSCAEQPCGLWRPATGIFRGLVG
jgi:hypothetical protein